MVKKALITGVTGQDGAYLAKLLLSKEYKVHGALRPTSAPNAWRLAELGVEKDVDFVDLDLFEQGNIVRVIETIAPDEVYNLAAQSFVGISFEQPVYTGEIDGLGVTRILEALRQTGCGAKFYQASSSEMFGRSSEALLSEESPFKPASPYAVAKLYGHHITVNYRESYGLHASCGILFNHESPLRGKNFVTRKITNHLAEVKHGLRDQLRLGNMQVKRDWGFAADYVEGMYLMLQQEAGGDYVLATGKSCSVQDFVNAAADVLGMKLEWSGDGMETVGVETKTGRTVVSVDPQFFRPVDIDVSVGDASKAQNSLGWKAKTSVQELVAMMVEADEKEILSRA
jgi:GDPmannose 4,6-dehydratase